MEALKLNTEKNNQQFKSSNKSTSERVKETYTEGLVFGICSQIGSQKNIVINELTKTLEEFGYEVVLIKLSKTITSYIESPKKQSGKTKKYLEYIQKIETGNSIRGKYGSDFLANVAISIIADQKKKHFSVNDEKDFSKIKSQRICYIVDSIKHTEELKTFRDVYKDIFYLISIYTPREERLKHLSIPNLSQEEANELINKDQFEDDENGQQVRDVFIDSDFFVRIDKSTTDRVKKNIQRYINLIFEYGVETPTMEERAMYEAKSASVNSACLSRQVGASIISNDGQLLSTGWNDVPKFGGNLYTSDDKNDNRCFLKGICFNDSNKKEIKEFITNEFSKNLNLEEILPKKNSIKEEEYLEVNKKISNFLEEILETSSIKSLIEFSRSVHAEMHAIINAGNLNGDKIKGGTLFCTTYPCHNCARHIVASGIKKVYYIEPYVKSKAPILHEDSITDNEEVSDKVQLLFFDGVSPRRYLNFFNKDRPRKKSGVSLGGKLNKKDLYPTNSISLQALFYLETQAAHRISDKQNNENAI
ncbi:anti-phage dCTP deaminase [Cellulophaga tyrosinoxydans]|uniref:Cytidine and deoxycytidylate deaminase zinc-binding region n=1 Tax=Cellulophaga tyrosinoxydans TaxID=504486 RepID=A0A1W1YUK8_9FLAO|nr:anti-phage dCTP deaminase [Cellulophaga tyrosinoxydans]SMC39782.1 Cytidine and deoxycytidylate deaminase zinc-binding region [Cellulophaga tyrosinoxydans]